MTLDASSLYFDNLFPTPNRISPFAEPRVLTQSPASGYYEDFHFGYSWTFRIAEGDAIYGATGRFLPSHLEEFGTGAYARVPFRRIPRIQVSSYRELLGYSKSSISHLNSFVLLWRGQVREYLLERAPSDKLKLYGDADVFEPSLRPSASRKNIEFESYMSGWLGLLETFIESKIRRLARIYAPSTVHRFKEEAENLRSTYRFKQWAFAIAQHYGLPSTGLDLTDNVETALFFALNSFTFDPDGKMRLQRATPADHPVIYVMGVPESDLLRDADLAPEWLQALRPKEQGAFFFGTAWGKASNRAAERIIAILELRDHAEWIIPNRRHQYFPSIADDEFSAFLMDARSRYPSLAKVVPLHMVYS